MMKGWIANFEVCLFIVVLVAILLPHGAWSAPRRRIIELRSSKIDGPPVRPKHFDSVEQLNQYLADVAEYYKMMGRPRFGKRSYAGSLTERQRRFIREAAESHRNQPELTSLLVDALEQEIRNR